MKRSHWGYDCGQIFHWKNLSMILGVDILVYVLLTFPCFSIYPSIGSLNDLEITRVGVCPS